MNKSKLHGILVWIALTIVLPIQSQDSLRYRLRLDFPVLDFPQNTDLAYKLPSMNQALEWSNDFYELGFWGIDALGDRLFVNNKTKPVTVSKKRWNAVFKYGMVLLFSRYGSELPIPLGVWAHEEYHKAVLGVNGIRAKNGNWMLNRWDGTVYGVSDSSLNHIKATHTDALLYSYVAGVQYEVALNQKITVNDFYKNRSLAKNALLLYNAWYVYNYFKFSVGPFSDSVKVLAPPHESPDPSERDYAGSDLTAWAYDMYNPKQAFVARDSFPGGEGVNRRLGFSDLSPEAQRFLVQQKNLSLLNFLNPAIFFINRIPIGDKFSFNAFMQYAPTHFGNAISLVLPFQYDRYDMLLSFTNYNSKEGGGMALACGLYNFAWSGHLETDLNVQIWQQPNSFLDQNLINGGAATVKTRYRLNSGFWMYLTLSGKTNGWLLSNPYLEKNVSMQIGLQYNLKAH